jgi:hypothetical protein
VAQWVGHLVLAPEVEAEAAAEVGAQGATAQQIGGAATLAGYPLCLRQPLGSAALVRASLAAFHLVHNVAVGALGPVEILFILVVVALIVYVVWRLLIRPRR